MKKRKRIQTIAAALTLDLLITGCSSDSDTEQREEGEYQTIELTMLSTGRTTRSTPGWRITSPSWWKSVPAAM